MLPRIDLSSMEQRLGDLVASFQKGGLRPGLDVEFTARAVRADYLLPREIDTQARGLRIARGTCETSVKAGIKNRRLLAASDDGYRQKLLHIQATA